jgi:polysaccharide biosynthesis transport protein
MKPERSTDSPAFSRHSRQLQDSSLDAGDFDAPSERRSSFGPLLRVIRRNIFLAASVSTVVAIATTTALKTVAPVPIYEGSFQLLVEPVTSEARAAEPLAVTRADGQVPNQDAFVLDYPTQIAILTSPKLLSKIVERIQIRYPNFDEATLATTLKVQRGVDSNTSSPTKTIEVHYQGEDPDLIQFVLGETAKEYMRYSLEDRKTRIGSGVEFIEQQLPTVQNRVNVLQQQLQNLQQRYGLIDPSQQGQQLSTQVGAVTDLQLDTQRQLREQRVLYANLQKQLELNPTEAIAASALSENPSYRDALSKLQEVESQLAIETARFREESPVVQALRQRQTNLTALLDKEAQQIVGQNSGGTANPRILNFQNSVRIDLIGKLVEASSQIQMLQARSQEISQASRLFQQRLEQFPVVAREYSDLQRQLEIATRTLDQLQTQRDTLQIRAAQSAVPWELVAIPGRPNPISPESDRSLLLAGILALISGVGAAIALDKLRNVFHTEEEIQETLQLPVLGVIPFFQGAEQLPISAASSIHEQEWDSTNSDLFLFQEAFSSLYASIRFLASSSPIRSLVVCSAAHGDGKTAIAFNLARTVAMMGQRVLLVDANLRSTQVDRRSNLQDWKGLSEILVDGLSPDELIRRSSVSEKLSLLSSGQPTLEAIRLLASNQMQTLMGTFQTKFDLVIYDTPPLLGLTDASFLAPNTDGVLLVVAVNKTSRSIVVQAHHELRNFGLTELGMVVNHPNQDTKRSHNYSDWFNSSKAKNTMQFHPEGDISNLSEV